MSKAYVFQTGTPCLFFLLVICAGAAKYDSVWARGDYDADNDSSVLFSNLVDVPESWGEAASVNTALCAPLFSPDSFKCRDGDINCAWCKLNITKGLLRLWQRVQSACVMWPTQCGHNGEYTPCAVNKWIRPQKANKNTEIWLLWAKKTKQKSHQNIIRAAACPSVHRLPHLFHVDKITEWQVCQSSRRWRETCWCPYDFSVGFNYLHRAWRHHKGSFDKHWLKPEACGQLCDCQMLERFGCVTGYFLPINWCTTMEYSTRGKNTFPPIRADTLTHIFQASRSTAYKFWCFLFGFSFWKFVVFSQKKNKKLWPIFFPTSSSILPLSTGAVHCKLFRLHNSEIYFAISFSSLAVGVALDLSIPAS